MRRGAQISRATGRFGFRSQSVMRHRFHFVVRFRATSHQREDGGGASRRAAFYRLAAIRTPHCPQTRAARYSGHYCTEASSRRNALRRAEVPGWRQRQRHCGGTLMRGSSAPLPAACSLLCAKSTGCGVDYSLLDCALQFAYGHVENTMVDRTRRELCPQNFFYIRSAPSSVFSPANP